MIRRGESSFSFQINIYYVLYMPSANGDTGIGLIEIEA